MREIRVRLKDEGGQGGGLGWRCRWRTHESKGGWRVEKQYNELNQRHAYKTNRQYRRRIE